MYGILSLLHHEQNKQVQPMARTESKVFYTHPALEQNLIDLMQHFGWSLLMSQEVKTIDNRVEQAWWDHDHIQTRHRESRYIRLTFHRDLDTPNLARIKELEHKFFAINTSTEAAPNNPNFYFWMTALVSFIVTLTLFGYSQTELIVSIIVAIVVIVIAVYYNLVVYLPQVRALQARISAENRAFEYRRQEILQELRTL